MEETLKALFNTNQDVLSLMSLIKGIGWNALREHSIQRTIYLSKVLYSFVSNDEKNLFDDYHFSVTITGPYTELINRSIVDLTSRELIIEDLEGNLKTTNNKITINQKSEKYIWFKTVVLILGLYGEDKIFSFTINDPLYLEAVKTNSQKELQTSPENKTVKVLNDFKTSFEETLSDVSKISKVEYIELYFEYIFSQIINRGE